MVVEVDVDRQFRHRLPGLIHMLAICGTGFGGAVAQLRGGLTAAPDAVQVGLETVDVVDRLVIDAVVAARHVPGIPAVALISALPTYEPALATPCPMRVNR